MIYVNDDLEVSDPVELKIEGDYLVGTVSHLSKYILTGDIVEETGSYTVDEVVPKTGDNIYMWVAILLVSIIGLSVGALSLRKRVKNKI